MKKNIFPFPGKDWLRASFRKMQNRLMQAILDRFIPFVPVYSFRGLSVLYRNTC
ncbi:MAG: hypothetical protein MI685_06190 [Chlorobiales bacterium]|nr:hypothetical protein [Chlorobiales bacterium]